MKNWHGLFKQWESMEIKTFKLKVISGLLTGSGPRSHDEKKRAYIYKCVLMVCEIERPY